MPSSSSGWTTTKVLPANARPAHRRCNSICGNRTTTAETERRSRQR
ncbi:hypothetical protein SHIRM173S_02956 [Streptomyces hirsutus]